MGFAEGTSSLFKHTVAGTFTSFTKLTGSISRNFSKLSFDDEFLEKRRKFMLNKPKHLGNGIE